MRKGRGLVIRHYVSVCVKEKRRRGARRNVRMSHFSALVGGRIESSVSQSIAHSHQGLIFLGTHD